MKKVLITGITGFAGSYLAEHLLSFDDHELYGTYLTDSSLDNVAAIKDSLALKKIDLTDGDAVQDYIRSVQPDEIYHLAALPSPADSFENPSHYIHNNVDVQLHILEALRKNKFLKTRVLIVSSGEIYGKVSPSDLPLNELTQFRPTSPYSVSKVTQDLLGLQYFIAYDMPIIRVRPFNHIGPRQSPAFVVATFAKQVAEAEITDQSPVVKVGNLVAKRDLTDVRDMVRAYKIVMERGELGEVYNIGTGKSVAMQEIIDTLITLSSRPITTELDQGRLRPSDIPDIVCDAKKIQDLGWNVQIPLDQTLKDTLLYWRKIVKKS